MPRGPEAKIVAQILAAYRSRGAYAVKIHGERYQTRTVDILACYRGVFVALEVKRDSRQTATAHQLATLEEVRRAKGVGVVVSDAVGALAELTRIDARHRRSSSIRTLLSRMAEMGNPQDYPERPKYPKRLDLPFEWFEDAFNLLGDGRE